MAKKKRAKKGKFGFLKIIVTILILLACGFLYLSRGAKVEIDYNSEFLLGKPVEMTITTKKNFKIHTPESLTISVSNRYNQNESFEKELVAYDEGTYQLLITPAYAGEYTVDIQYQDGDDSKSFSDDFLIK